MAVLSSGKMLSSWTIGSCETPAGVDFSIERGVEEKSDARHAVQQPFTSLMDTGR